MLSSTNTWLIIDRVPAAHFPRSAQNLMLFLCEIHGEIQQARYTTPNKMTLNIRTSTQLREILYSGSQDMVVLSTTVASRYYNFCTDGSASTENYGYSPSHTKFNEYLQPAKTPFQFEGKFPAHLPRFDLCTSVCLLRLQTLRSGSAAFPLAVCNL
jgi:hypothetical protein